jgi:translation initiation factor IF-3
MVKTNNYYEINERIRAPQLRVITSTGENLGTLSKDEAVREARKRELDLVVIAPNSEPPVAKILDFSKFLYEERKKKSAAKAKAKKSELKEFRFGPTIGDGDLNSRIDRTKEFINDGNRVKISVVLKGREGMFPQIAYDRIKKVEQGLADTAKAEAPASRNGNIISIVFVGK